MTDTDRSRTSTQRSRPLCRRVRGHLAISRERPKPRGQAYSVVPVWDLVTGELPHTPSVPARLLANPARTWTESRSTGPNAQVRAQWAVGFLSRWL